MSCESQEIMLDLVLTEDGVENDGVIKTDGGGSTNNSKVCSVCGDVALGYNFNALTCESCKAFFRRNALKAKEFKCPFTESCVMTAITRRFCQRCRLQKCFSVGMRKEYIMSEEERLNKRNKIEQNRARKRAAAQVPNGSEGRSSKQSRSLRKAKSAHSNSENIDFGESTSATEWYSESSIKFEGVPTTPSQQMSPPQSSEPISERLLESFPSPTTASSAASVPSPSSPPDSATVAASHNIEMIAKQDGEIDNKQVMISVITYPQHSKISRSDVNENSTTSSSSTQTVFNSSSSPRFKTIATQTLPQQQPSPLLKSLISSQRSDDTGNSEAASTSPFTPKTADCNAAGNNVSRPEGSLDAWNDTDSTSAWQSCIPGSASQDCDEAHELLQDVLNIRAVPNSIQYILSEAIKLEFSSYMPNSLPNPHFHPQMQYGKELNDAERAKLNELIVANKALLAPFDEATTSADHGPALLDIINLTAIAIRRLVKMAKKINAFKNMCQEDQVALLKGACMEMLILHSAMKYNPDRDSWDIPNISNPKLANISVDVLKECKGNLYQEHRRFQRTFNPCWRRDENIMLILNAIALFTPDRPCVVHHDVIKLEQNSYYYLLRRYLECTLPGCEARSTFLKLIEKMSDLHRLNEEHVRGYLDVDPSEVEPLLIEIFDLKPPSMQNRFM